MKLRFLILVSSLIFSGCSIALSTLEPGTPAPDVMPRLDPSPTPSGSPLPMTCQVTDLKVYINEMDGYCFAYPLRFTLQDQPSDKPDIQGPGYGNGGEPIHATFSVEVGPANTEFTDRGEAEIFLKEFSVVDPDTFVWNQVMVDGEWEWIVEPVPTRGAWRFVFVQHNGYLYRLSYWPVDIPEARADVDELTQTSLGSFAFTR